MTEDGAAIIPLSMLGTARLLERPLLGLLTSAAPPPDLVLPALDLARSLRDVRPVTILSGFQTPLERKMLKWLLSGAAAVVIAPARSIAGIRLPTDWQRAIEQERLALVSSMGSGERRVTRASARQRNDFVTERSEALFIVHARPHGTLLALADEAISAGKPVYTFEHPGNRDLILLGAEPIARHDPTAFVRALLVTCSGSGGNSRPQRPHPIHYDEEARPEVSRDRHPQRR